MRVHTIELAEEKKNDDVIIEISPVHTNSWTKPSFNNLPTTLTRHLLTFLKNDERIKLLRTSKEAHALVASEVLTQIAGFRVLFDEKLFSYQKIVKQPYYTSWIKCILFLLVLLILNALGGWSINSDLNNASSIIDHLALIPFNRTQNAATTCQANVQQYHCIVTSHPKDLPLPEQCLSLCMKLKFYEGNIIGLGFGVGIITICFFLASFKAYEEISAKKKEINDKLNKIHRLPLIEFFLNKLTSGQKNDLLILMREISNRPQNVAPSIRLDKLTVKKFSRYFRNYLNKRYGRFSLFSNNSGAQSPLRLSQSVSRSANLP